ncbi:DNA binding domain-containing protein, excisionase family [Roseivivax marinus]|uniref:helix-turn-helix transcriptional regulator n=1 Tax=Roseivivax marinus TaxID=1379903 RepID=UPI0008D3EBA1|nr:helix-turn-helix transcriptional regulator [Roseivivax marinus]SEK52420.1 DNA binding domain-containing protein, excisionase family [Roseivivax marinus]
MSHAPQTDPEFLTVPELAALLRIKERKVYDLAASGAVPCARVTGKLLFPARAVRDWIAAGATSGAAPAPGLRPDVFLGSHDPLLDWALRQAGTGLATYFSGSGDGLSRFAAREGVATGLHILEDGAWNVAAARRTAPRDAVLLSFARRSRGLVTRPGSGIAALADLAGRRLQPRQAGSGTETVFAHLLSEAGLSADAFDTTAPALSEQDAVLAVQQGAADATFGLAALARQHGLEVVPLVEERFDLLVDRTAYFEPPLQRLAAFLRSDALAAQAERLGGYDVSEAGTVRWNGD